MKDNNEVNLENLQNSLRNTKEISDQAEKTYKENILKMNETIDLF